MYSYEDRIRAVELYIKLGKRTGATIRQLGYPTKNSLKSWHEEYERRLDLSSGYVRSKPKYSQIQKEQAVKHYAEHGRCIASTVKALGYLQEPAAPLHLQRAPSQCSFKHFLQTNHCWVQGRALRKCLPARLTPTAQTWCSSPSHCRRCVRGDPRLRPGPLFTSRSSRWAMW